MFLLLCLGLPRPSRRSLHARSNAAGSFSSALYYAQRPACISALNATQRLSPTQQPGCSAALHEVRKQHCHCKQDLLNCQSTVVTPRHNDGAHVMWLMAQCLRSFGLKELLALNIKQLDNGEGADVGTKMVDSKKYKNKKCDTNWWQGNCNIESNSVNWLCCSKSIQRFADRTTVDCHPWIICNRGLAASQYQRCTMLPFCHNQGYVSLDL